MPEMQELKAEDSGAQETSPPPGPGRAVSPDRGEQQRPLFIAMETHLQSVDTARQTIQARGWLQFIFVDGDVHREAAAGPGVVARSRWPALGGSLPVQLENGPALFHNSDNVRVLQVSVHPLGGDGDPPLVHMTIFYQGRFVQDFDLRRWPFDRQHAVVSPRLSRSASWRPFRRVSDCDAAWNAVIDRSAAGPYLRTFIGDDGRSKMTILTSVTAWGPPTGPHERKAHVELVEQPQAPGGLVGDPIFVMPIERKPKFFIWSFCFPLFLLVSLSSLSFLAHSTDRELSEDRMSITLTLILSVVAFKFVISEQLTTPATTFLDAYTLVSFVILCLVAVQNAVASSFSAEDADELRDFDARCAAAFAAVWGGGHLVLIALYKAGRYPLEPFSAVFERATAWDLPGVNFDY